MGGPLRLGATEHMHGADGAVSSVTFLVQQQSGRGEQGEVLLGIVVASGDVTVVIFNCSFSSFIAVVVGNDGGLVAPELNSGSQVRYILISSCLVSLNKLLISAQSSMSRSNASN